MEKIGGGGMKNSSISTSLLTFENPWTARIFSLFILIISLALFTGCSSMQNVVIKDMDNIQFGVASYYGKKFHGGKTACGETYDMNQLTAAHRVLPFGTLVKVTNVKNGRAVVVKINDRGPMRAKRVIDLSYAAARELGMVADGITRVRLDVISESLAMNPLDGQEFNGYLTLGNGIYRNNKIPAIQLYLPFESHHTNSVDSETLMFRINDELSNFDKGDIGLSGYIAGN